MGPAEVRLERARRSWERRRVRIKTIPRWVFYFLSGDLAFLVLLAILSPNIRAPLLFLVLLILPMLIFLLRWFIPRSQAIMSRLSFDEFRDRLGSLRAKKRPWYLRVFSLSLGLAANILVIGGLMSAFLGHDTRIAAVYLLVGTGYIAFAGSHWALDGVYRRQDEVLLGLGHDPRYQETTAAFAACGSLLVLLWFFRAIGFWA